MRKITRQILADVCVRIFEHAQNRAAWEKIKLLGEHPDPNAIDAIFGNDMWTEVPACDECEKTTEIVIEIGGEDDSICLCRDCLEKALKMCGE
jgi:hypothetical protein